MLTYRQEKWIKSIIKLIQLTQEKKIRWRCEQPPDTKKYHNVDLVYSTEFNKNEKEIILYETEVYFRNKSNRISKIFLELIGCDGTTLCKIDRVYIHDGENLLDDLLESVQSQTSELDKFLDELITY